MFLHVGYRNYVNAEKIHAIVKYENCGPAPIKRDIGHAREKGTLIDCTKGKRTISVIYTDEYIILSHTETDTLVDRLK